jgi:ubiquinone/menaquinone biosynthesis C-methylase UbiE
MAQKRSSNSHKQLSYVPFDRVAETFDRTRFIPLDALRRAYRLMFEKVAFEGEITILDAGVGTGRIIRPLMRRKVTLIGIDISLPMLTKLRQRYETRTRPMSLHLILADAEHLPIRPSSIAWVQSTHLLHLLRNWKAAVREWERVLRPNGSLVVFQESGRPSSVKVAYDRAIIGTTPLRRRGWHVYSKLKRFLRQSGWRLHQDKIEWVGRSSLLTVLRSFENRSYSRQWDLTEEIHRKAMANARAFVMKQYSRGIRSEKVPSSLLILSGTCTSKK